MLEPQEQLEVVRYRVGSALGRLKVLGGHMTSLEMRDLHMQAILKARELIELLERIECEVEEES